MWIPCQVRFTKLGEFIKQGKLSGDVEACTFCNVINGKEESFKVFEDDKSMAFLDINPLFPGHLLLVPKKHYGNFEELPNGTIADLFCNVKMLSGALEEGLGAEGTFIAINNRVSQSVPHLHIHVVPRRFKDGLRGFFWPRNPYKGRSEILEVQSKIANALKRLHNNGKIYNDS
jgi:histidine triad (HIT) family protein